VPEKDLFAADQYAEGNFESAAAGKPQGRGAHSMTHFLSNFFEARHKNVAGGEPRPATKLLYQHLSKKAGNLDLNNYTHADTLWESTLRRRRVFNPEDLSRALADLAMAGVQVIVLAKLTFRNYDLQTPWFEPSLARLANLEGGDDMVKGSGPRS
jgi:hypothetical protein